MSNRSLAPLSIALVGLFVGFSKPVAAQQDDFSKVQIEVQDLAPGLFFLSGRGGNIALLAGPDGALLVDDQYAPLAPKIVAAIATKTAKPVRLLVNTHWHGDHTGGNESFAKAGAIILAHENVLKRLSSDQFIRAFNRQVPAAPEIARPVVTFSDAIDLAWGGEEVHVAHVRPAHTDSDSILEFRHADVVHMGDTFFNGIYPFIDVDTGGSLDGMIAADDQALAKATAKTKIIPGHGPMGDRAALAAFRDMLTGVRDAVAQLVAEGKTEDQIVAAHPTARWDETWGKGFMSPESFTHIVYRSLKEGAASPSK